jgi:hypothetical protein
MSGEKDDETGPGGPFEQRLKADLQKIVAGTSPALRARISEIAAVAASAGRRPRSRRLYALIPVGGVAATLVVALTLHLHQPQSAAPAKSSAIPPEDIALLLDVDNLDLLEQMEFYQWVDRESGALDAEGATAPKSSRRS